MKNTAFHDYLENEFKNMKWENSKIEKIICWTAVAIAIVSFVVMLFIYLSPNIPIYKLGNVWILGIVSVIAIIVAIVAGILQQSKRRKNKTALFSYIPDDIYEQYYELSYPHNVMKFKGFRLSTVYPNSLGMTFEINGEYVWWDIREHTEIRTRTVTTKEGTRTETYTVYILNYMVRLASKRIEGYEPILLETNSKLKKVFSKKDDDQEFFSASITFNQKFKVTGNNKMQMTRLFDPSVVDYFDQIQNLDFYKKHRIYIKDGLAYTSWKSGDSTRPWGANLKEFQYLKITRQNFIQEITTRIENDFNRYFDMLYLFRPFDFYRVYQQKN